MAKNRTPRKYLLIFRFSPNRNTFFDVFFEKSRFSVSTLHIDMLFWYQKWTFLKNTGGIKHARWYAFWYQFDRNVFNIFINRLFPVFDQKWSFLTKNGHFAPQTIRSFFIKNLVFSYKTDNFIQFSINFLSFLVTTSLSLSLALFSLPPSLSPTIPL